MARDEPVTAVRRASAALQELIQRERLRPGDRIGREDELAERLGTSRLVLREALQVLSASHLIRTHQGPGGGVIVANTFTDGVGLLVSESVAELLHTHAITPSQLLEARIALEVPLAGVAARTADAEARANMLAAIDHAECHIDNRKTVVDDGAAFHHVIADAAMNSVVASVTSWMFDVLEPELGRLLGPRVDDREVVAQHRLIYDAIVDGDAVAAEGAMDAHLRYLGEAASLQLR